MSKSRKIVLMPLIASITFMIAFWLTQVRAANTVMGLSSDLVAGVITGTGLGVLLVVLWSLRRASITS